jgi:hypothetical protein
MLSFSGISDVADSEKKHYWVDLGSESVTHKEVLIVRTTCYSIGFFMEKNSLRVTVSLPRTKGMRYVVVLTFDKTTINKPLP